MRPRHDPAPVPPQPQADAVPGPTVEQWPFVKFRVPPTWMLELDAIAGERAISRADLGRMIFRDFLKDRLSPTTGAA